jgi:hypothetical protein
VGLAAWSMLVVLMRWGFSVLCSINLNEPSQYVWYYYCKYVIFPLAWCNILCCISGIAFFMLPFVIWWINNIYKKNYIWI